MHLPERKMDMLKKMMCLLMLMAFMLPCAVMAETVDGTMDPDFPVFEWERDAKEHWRVLDNGEKADAAAHVMQDVFCEVCESEIWLFDDGYADVSNYNDYGELVRSTAYDETGEVAYDCVFAYGYDENGVKLWEKQYEQGWFVSEAVYALNAEGENWPVWSAAYYDDGTSARNEYDEHGNVIKAYTYDVDGSVTYESTSEYALNADGWYYEKRQVVVMEGTTFINEYNEYGDWTYVNITEADGMVISDAHCEYEYQDGVKVSSKQYEAGVLIFESYYDEWGQLVKEIEHMEDGTVEVYEFDENGDLINR